MLAKYYIGGRRENLKCTKSIYALNVYYESILNKGKGDTHDTVNDRAASEHVCHIDILMVLDLTTLTHDVPLIAKEDSSHSSIYQENHNLILCRLEVMMSL